jgi:hypothetical protein
VDARPREAGRALPAHARKHRGGPDAIRHFANRNDFLTTPADVAWIRETLVPERVTLFPTGGHLGNLYKPEVQAEIMASIADLVAGPDSGSE